MTFTDQIAQKMHSLTYKLRARRFKRSRVWRTHPHNKELAPTDWQAVQQGIAALCRDGGIALDELRIDKNDYAEFKRRLKLPPLSLYALNCREKKFMEHYIAFKLLNLQPNQRYLDIASESSPFPDLARRRLGLETYSQDLTYPAGIRGHRIGSSADQLPIPADWADGASLQCAFEHFQGQIDTNFIRELARVLKPGGKCVIVPLYMHHEPLNIYDPILYSDWNDSKADSGATIVAEIDLGGHFERIYSPETLKRILIRGIGLSYHVFCITGLNAIAEAEAMSRHESGPLQRVRYALLVEKIHYDSINPGAGHSRTRTAAAAGPH
jgi:SAM-dependent methyltransferase